MAGTFSMASASHKRGGTAIFALIALFTEILDAQEGPFVME